MKFCPDFATNSRKEWRVPFFHTILRKQIRNLPKILKSEPEKWNSLHNALENKQMLRRFYYLCAEKHVLLERLFLSFFSLNHQKSWTGNVDENDWSVRFTLWALNITYSILFPLNSNANTFQFEAPLIRCDASSVSHGDTPLNFLKDSWRRKILEDEKTEVCPGMTTSDY